MSRVWLFKSVGVPISCKTLLRLLIMIGGSPKLAPRAGRGDEDRPMIGMTTGDLRVLDVH